MNRKIIVHVPSGIGDIHWVYAKLSLVTGIDVCYMVASEEPKRSLPYLRLLDNVSEAGWSHLSTGEILKRGNQQFKTWESLLESLEDDAVCIQLNDYLAGGSRIETYFPDLATNYHYNMNIPDSAATRGAKLADGNHLLFSLYPSNFNAIAAWRGWTLPDWVEFAKLINRSYPEFSFVVLGAEFDRQFCEALVKAMSERRLPVIPCIGEALATALYIITKSRHLVAFPSGIPILATVVGTPVTMFYPSVLRSLQRSWVDPIQLADGSYRAVEFCRPSYLFDCLNESSLDVGLNGKRNRSDTRGRTAWN